MNDYLIQLHRDDCLWAELMVPGARLNEVREELAQRFPSSEGFSLRVQQRKEQRRIVECGPEGIRLLGVQYQYLEHEEA
ncbi:MULTISPECIES: hypothetical protein [unclassified Pseudomonas]|uniref:hypothetical protein n=1 Tax=unclassified Pseudomonas TaxID=196821 RepID=UPI00244C19A0|nr:MULTISPECIES: hypothetical protein [unclassified Pseudomonas]MDG9925906.1 hypothetical protein [Pseudomonas sp. GD04045]MDH0034810.1 hypothetical protein [Pseudomonas sp. GD04019]